MSLIAPAEIDHVQRAAIKLLTDAVTQAVKGASDAPDRLGPLLDQVLQHAAEVEQQVEAAVQQAEAAATNAKTALQKAIDDAVADAIAQAQEQVAAAEAAAKSAAEAARVQVEEALGLAGAQLQQLKQLAEHPDWFGALMLALAKIVELANDPNHLTVHVVKPADGFSRAVGLRLAMPTNDGSTPPAAIVALALEGPGTTGLVVSVTGSAPHTIHAGPVTITLEGEGQWRIPFASPLPNPTAAMKISVAIHQPTAPPLSEASGILTVSTGLVNVDAGLEAGPTGPVTWRLRLALEGDGSPKSAGAQAAIDFEPFLGSTIAGIIGLTKLEERFSPTFAMASGTAPVFDLHHSGSL